MTCSPWLRRTVMWETCLGGSDLQYWWKGVIWRCCSHLFQSRDAPLESSGHGLQNGQSIDDVLSLAETYGHAGNVSRWVYALVVICFNQEMRPRKALAMGFKMGSQSMTCSPWMRRMVMWETCLSGSHPQYIYIYTDEKASFDAFTDQEMCSRKALAMGFKTSSQSITFSPWPRLTVMWETCLGGSDLQYWWKGVCKVATPLILPRT